jgi:VanZ family protein
MVKSEFQTIRWRERALRYAPLILWIGVIFLLSSGNASMSKTSLVIRPLLEFLFPGAPEETLIAYHAFIRKCAHFTEYGILAFWALRAFKSSSVQILQKYQFVWALLAVALVAVIDETNQSFNPARTGSPWDVLLDVSGGLAMLLFIVFYRFISRSRV